MVTDQKFEAQIFITMEGLYGNCIGQISIKPLYAANDQINQLNEEKASKKTKKVKPMKRK